ncbi:ATP-grasp domain-containing protein [Anaerovibrio lipolyticus]|uniref:ATP-grasp domain-containing protein n=1 Tax=Anaerovibrio lipolyticus TaxID=82374 RepID=UPI000480F57F|nr:ATP-grasp domain-containing protein [Anaerovibrio lipolyticus]
MEKVNVLITGAGGGGVGEQIIKCLKLSELSVYMICTDIGRASKGFAEVDKGYLVPKADDPRYLEKILKICKSEGVKIIFPGSEKELSIISNYRALFESNDICLGINSKEVIDVCMDKNKTLDFLEKNCIEIQKHWNVASHEDMDKIDVFPVVLKPSVGGGGSANTFVAQDKKELELFGEYLLSIYDVFTVQEYIGDPEHEYTVGVMSGQNGEYINSIAVKKNILSGLSNRMKIPNRTGRAELGDIIAISSGVSQGRIGKFKEVTEPCKKIANALKSKGPINIQGRIHNGKFYVFEINPRISGTSPLRAMVGYNEPEMLIRERILGETIQSDFEYREADIVRGLSEILIDDEKIKNITDFTT